MRSPKINLRKVTLAALTGFCFWVAFERIRDSYVELVPLGYENTCYSVKYPNFKNRYQLRIDSNSNETRRSKVTLSLINNPAERWSDEYSYFQLRLLNPKKMECL